MPILAVDQGIELRGAQFPQIATVRKGSPKTNGGQMGKNLPYFRIVFNKGEDAACAVFNKTFGVKPTQFEAMAPFNEIARFWDYWREGYIRAGGSAGGMMIHRCDGAWINFERDQKTRQITVMNWLDLNGQRAKCQCEGGAGRPLFVGKNKEGKQVPYFCKPVGRLSLIVPTLKREAYVLLNTTSIYDIMNITNNLKAILDNNGHILGIPLVVSRREVEVNTPYGRRMESLIFIEASPRYVEARIAQMEYEATPRVPQLTIGKDLLPSPQVAEVAGEEVDGEIVDTETGEVVEPGADQPDAQRGPDWDSMPEQPPEEQTTTATPAAPEPAQTWASAKAWPNLVLQLAVSNKLAKNAQNAAGMLNLSNVITPADATDVIMTWARLYRQYRDGNNEPEAAANLADGELSAKMQPVDVPAG
jgi:hypothetical protein